MDIVGKTIQNGEPTPEHPVEIENKINILLAVDDENNSEKEYKLPFLTNIEQQAIETVLSELENKDKEIEKLKKDNNELLRKLRNRVKEVNKLTKYSLYKKEFSTLNKQLEKKDKEYEELTEASKELCKTVNLMKKVINEMAKHIHLSGDYACLYEECDDNMDRECEDCIKEYFYKKVKETKDNGSTKNV